MIKHPACLNKVYRPGFPPFLCQCTLSAFRQTSMYPFSISKDNMHPFSISTDERVPLKFLMTKYFIMINHRYI